MGVQNSEYRQGVIDVILSPSAVASAIGAEQTFTVPGLTMDMVVVVQKPTTQTGLGLGGARVSSVGTLAINFTNVNASTAITPTASETYTIWWMKPEAHESSVRGA